MLLSVLVFVILFVAATLVPFSAITNQKVILPPTGVVVTGKYGFMGASCNRGAYLYSDQIVYLNVSENISTANVHGIGQGLFHVSMSLVEPSAAGTNIILNKTLTRTGTVNGTELYVLSYVSIPKLYNNSYLNIDTDFDFASLNTSWANYTYNVAYYGAFLTPFCAGSGNITVPVPGNPVSGPVQSNYSTLELILIRILVPAFSSAIFYVFYPRIEKLLRI